MGKYNNRSVRIIYSFRNFLLERVLGKIPDYQETTVRGQKLFWYYTVFYIDKLSKHKDVLKTFFENQKKDIVQKFFVLAAGEALVKEHNSKPREFIFSYFKEKKLDKSDQNTNATIVD